MTAEIRQALFATVALLIAPLGVLGQVKVTVDHNAVDRATSTFKFKSVPPPAKEDAGHGARLLLIDGELDTNGADLSALTDGVLPTQEDEPAKSLFFNAGTGGGRLRLEFPSVIEITQVNTYSWHPNTRGPQVYRLWASDGSDARFNAAPKGNVDPTTCGWKLITTVDTRSQNADDDGGQYGVSITDGSGSLGRYRYLLIDCYVTETADDYGNTFYSEIDVVAKK